jgi:hypothetical protein
MYGLGQPCALSYFTAIRFECQWAIQACWTALEGSIICMFRVGQNHIYTVFVRYCWQENHQIYGHIRCIYTVLANPRYVRCHASILALGHY